MDSECLLMQAVSKLHSLLTSLNAILGASSVERLQELESLISSTIKSQTSHSKFGNGSLDSYGIDVIEEVVEEDATEYIYVEMETDDCVSTIDVKPKLAAISVVDAEPVVLVEGQADHYNEVMFEDSSTQESGLIKNLKPLENQMGGDNSDGAHPESGDDGGEDMEEAYVAPPQFKFVIVKMADDGLEYHCYEESMEQETATVISDFKLVPRGSRTYLCGYCDCESPRSNRIKVHVMKHMPKEKYSLECHLCQKKYGSQNSLNCHLSRHAEDYMTRFKCAFANCEYSCGSKQNFDRHVRRMHTFDKPYTCDDCGKSFPASEERKEHMRIYHKADFKPTIRSQTARSKRKSGQRPGSVGRTSSSRLLSEGMPEKPYSCGFCDIGFKTSAELYTHIPKCELRVKL